MDLMDNVFVEKTISRINPATDSKVRILGTVVSKIDNSIFVDDGTGTVQVVVGQDMGLNVSVDQMVRVFGRLRFNDDDFDLFAELIQNMDGLNLKLYNVVMDYYRNV